MSIGLSRRMISNFRFAFVSADSRAMGVEFPMVAVELASASSCCFAAAGSADWRASSVKLPVPLLEDGGPRIDT